MDSPQIENVPVPCKNATDYEINQGKHFTKNGNRVCHTCRHTLDRFLQALWKPEEESFPVPDDTEQ